jgi:hypothetical protein
MCKPEQRCAAEYHSVRANNINTEIIIMKLAKDRRPEHNLIVWLPNAGADLFTTHFANRLVQSLPGNA